MQDTFIADKPKLNHIVLFITGMENIRDVIPFPRFPGHADF